LRTIRVGKTGTVFIANEKGQLMSAQDARELTRVVEGKELPELRTIEQSSNRLLQLASAALAAEKLTLADIHGIRPLTYTDPKTKESYFVTLTDAGRPGWVVGTVIPESDFMDEIEQGTRKILYMVLIFVTIAGGLASHLSRKLVQKTEEAFVETEEARREAEAQRRVAVEKGKQLEVRNRFIKETFGRYLSD